MATGEAYTRTLGELHQLQREMIEQRYLRRADGTERVAEAVRRLGEVGSPGGLITRSAQELGESSDFDQVLLSRVGQPAELLPLAGWTSSGVDPGLGALGDRPIALGYPLIEDEVVRRRGSALVGVADSGSRAPARLTQAMGWDQYVVAAIVLGTSTVGLLHAGRATGPPLGELELEVATLFADGLGRAFERAVLRETLERQRGQLQAAARWINTRMLDLSSEEAPNRDDLRDVLTAREVEVLRLITRGLSNRAIATKLMLREGTVKYHVKNILRKLQSRSRAEAVSRYMQLYAGSEGP